MTDNSRQSVVLDVMGADHGPDTIIRGGLAAARNLGDSLHLTLVGKRELIDRILAHVADRPSNVSVEHAPAEVPMTMSATDGVRVKDSSIAVGLNLVRHKKADAFVSPGHTGAVMASSLLILGRIHGVIRPAIAGAFPTSTGRPCIVLDVGANVDCKPQHISQFAVMGSVYSEILFDTHNPRVGLVSIGEERSKGNELIFAARKLLSESKINFVGNIEGRDILSGDVDVAVTDGFTGNIILKFGESVLPFVRKAINHQVQTNFFSRIGVTLLLPFLRRLKRSFDYAQTGGAPLLGVNGVVTICHGSSSAEAITNAVSVAHDMARKRINECIHRELSANHFGKKDEPSVESQDLRNGVICPTGSDD
ncbi:MAG: phosphate acyltransferase PlsX [Candidatus Zixiibacteriota bacterium]